MVSSKVAGANQIRRSFGSHVKSSASKCTDAKSQPDSLTQIVGELTPYFIGWWGYFGFCQNSSRACEPGSVDPPKIALISLAAVGEWAQPFQRTAPRWRLTVLSRGCGRFTDRLLAYVRTPGGQSGPAQPPL